MYILSDTRFKEQISSSAFMVRGHRSHRYASAFQNDRRLRLTTKGWNPLPFFPHHRSPPLHGRLRSSCIFSLPVPPLFSFLFFLFCLFLPLFHRWLPATFKHTAVKIGKNCDLQSPHIRSLYYRFSLDSCSVKIRSSHSWNRFILGKNILFLETMKRRKYINELF